MIAIDDIEKWLMNPGAGLVRSARPGQLQMAKACAELMNAGGIGFLEAGTGTGKSIAYGLPAMLHDKRVVISTGKKALQEQLINKDLPNLRTALGRRDFALIKGAANYFCQLRYEEFAESDGFSIVTENEVLRLQAFLNKSETGDIGSFQASWTHAVRVADCVRASCPHVQDCAYIEMRNNAIRTPVVVVNHALLAQDLALGGGKIFGDYDVLVIDEGHNAPKAFREAFACTLTPQQPQQLDRWLRGADFYEAHMFRTPYALIFRSLQARAGVLEINPDLRRGFTQLRIEVSGLLENMSLLGLTDEGAPSESGENSSVLARQRSRYAGAARALKKIRKLCEIVLDVPREGFDSGPYCAAVTVSKTEEPQITVTPIEVGPLVAPGLLRARTLIVTSATLTTGGSFSYIADEYGFSTNQLKVQAVVPSPFKYAEQSVLYVSKTSPDPTQERGTTYYEKMVEEIHPLLHASGGGALVLCASRDDMEKIYNRLWEKHADDMPYALGMQGKESAERLTEWFKARNNAVLVALKTFWEGVDIPGLGLRLVVIPRIPFPNRGDVLLQARKDVYIARKVENGDEQEKASIDAWSKYDLNEALLDLAQGGGRLIRTETDLGVVALLDRRASGRTKQYSGRIRKAFPHPVCEDPTQVLNFLTALRASVGV